MAASYQVSPPEQFTFSRPHEWPKWIRRFERFRSASGLDSKGEEVQVNTLIYTMGDEADDILRSFSLSEEEKKVYATVKGKFQAHFVKRRNVIFERAKFNMRRQEDREPVDAFITDLYSLAEHCEYGTLHDEMIRDRIVVGLQDAKLAEKLQLDADLTLDKAVSQVRQAEAVKKQQAVIRSEGDSVTVGAINKETTGKPSRKYCWSQGQSKEKSCSWCGMTPAHDRLKCPAKEAVCRKCQKKGHYQRACRSAVNVGTLHSDHVPSRDGDEAFLGAVGEGSWKIQVELNGYTEEFCIDTGAEVTVIPECTYQSCGNPELMSARRVLRGPGQNELQVRGEFRGTMKVGDQSTEQQVYVVPGLQKPLLGQPAIEALQLLARVGVVEGNRSPVEQFPDLFKGLGKFSGEYTIQLREDAKPFALTTPRRVAIPQLPSVERELKRMEELGVVSPVEEATEWCAGMVVVPKSEGKVRICVDLTRLNACVLRERHTLPSVEQILAQVSGAQLFSKLDANSGFWQVPLAKESSLLTTFITPFGRFRFNRLPFGITSAPEYFQKRMGQVLTGMDGVLNLIDDVLVYGKTQEEHDERLMAVLQKLRKENITLNKEKCVFSSPRVKFLGQVLSKAGITADPDKITAILELPEPTNVHEVRQFLGMVNHLMKFTPNLADLTKPLRDLLSKDSHWGWDEQQKTAFVQIKRALTKSPVLALYDPNLETTVSADASSYGLGAVLLQKQLDGTIRPVAYISRSMSPTEQRYAQIEKEALALTWACERFADYLIGIKFHIETDHKPLVPLLSTKLLDELPIRVQRFRMRLLRYDFTISHTPGKELGTADVLSRAPTSSLSTADHSLQEQVDAYVQLVMDSLPATRPRLAEIKAAQEADEVCQKVVKYCREGWPTRVFGVLKKYQSAGAELSIEQGILMRGDRLVIPSALQNDILHRLHEGHQGVRKCRERAKQSVWWPGLSSQLEEVVRSCAECVKFQSQRAEPLKPTPLPSLPWQRVATDLFEWEKHIYLLIVDFYSRWIEIARLDHPSASAVVHHSKSIFARHGIPDEVISDNGPQYASQSYADFAKEYGFTHITSSPYHPQGNGEAERAVQTVKNLLKKKGDPYLALLAYRSTPLELGYTPSELLMGRKLATTIPMATNLLTPKALDQSEVRTRDSRVKEKQKENHDSHHRVRDLPELLPGDRVWVTDRQDPGKVVAEHSPRSYVVETGDGTYRRNRRHLIAAPSLSSEESTLDLPEQSQGTVESETEPRSPPKPPPTPRVIVTRSRTGKSAPAPDRLEPSW